MADPLDCMVIHLPAGSVDWASVLTQFTLHLSKAEGRSYATWAADRLLRLSRTADGLVALANGELLGLMLVEDAGDTVELSMPWVRTDDVRIAEDLATAAVHIARTEHPKARYVRAERQVLPPGDRPAGLAAAGFICHLRQRMALDLPGWRDDAITPAGYRIATWSIRDLDAAADVVYQANLGTLDAILYAPFFGDSPAQCRKGLLSILAGRYGPIHPQATLSAFHGTTLVGVNLVIHEGNGLASVVELSVDPRHQGHGLGRALMVHSLRILKHENMDRVELAVTTENTRAAQLYRALGFFEAGEFSVCVWPGPLGNA